MFQKHLNSLHTAWKTPWCPQNMCKRPAQPWRPWMAWGPPPSGMPFLMLTHWVCPRFHVYDGLCPFTQLSIFSVVPLKSFSPRPAEWNVVRCRAGGGRWFWNQKGLYTSCLSHLRPAGPREGTSCLSASVPWWAWRVCLTQRVSKVWEPLFHRLLPILFSCLNREANVVPG